VSARSDHAARMRVIRETYASTGVIVDPHTADGLGAARRYQRVGEPMIVLKTAQAGKFAEAIREALGCDPPRPPGFDGIERLPQRFATLPVDAGAVRRYLVERLSELTGSDSATPPPRG